MARRTKLMLGAIAAAVVAAMAGGIAWAAIPGPGGVIQGCYDNGGNVKVVDALPCPKGSKPLPWNQAGAPGVSGHEIVTETKFFDETVLGIFERMTVTCPEGKKVLGGGGSLIYGPGADPFLEGVTFGPGDVRQSFPVGDTGWLAVFSVENNPGPEPFTVSVYAICATVS